MRLPKFLQYAISVPPRHQPVEQDEIKLLGADGIQGFGGGVGGFHLKPALAETQRDEIASHPFVVDNQKAFETTPGFGLGPKSSDYFLGG
jgi:hypothetical protein